MIKYSGFTDEISSNFEEQLAFAKELGLSYISLRGVDNENIGDCSIETVRTYIKPLCQKYGISISSIGSPLGKISINDEEAFEKELVRAKIIAEIANILSCKYVRLFSFYIPHAHNPDDYQDSVVHKINLIIQILEKADLIGILENEKETYCDILSRCKQLVDEITNPNLKLAFDFANFVQCGVDPMEAYKLLSDRISYFHIKDAKFGGENVICGTGDGKIKEILYDSIIINKYSGFLTLEPHLAIFDSLAKLEQKKPEEIISNSQVENGYQGFKLQLKALNDILNSFQGEE